MTRKKLFALFLSVVVLTCALVTPASAASFVCPADVAGHQYQNDILTIGGYGGLAGIIDRDNKFYPNAPCTTCLFAQILQNLYPSVSVPAGYDTVDIVTQKNATNLLTYYSATLGHEVTWDGGSPSAQITRADAAHYIIGMLECAPDLVYLIGTSGNIPSTPTPNNPGKPSTPAPTPTQGKFSDVSPNAYYAMAVDWAVGYGITAGTSTTTFSPNDTCTVAQVLTFLYRTNGAPKPGNRDTCPFTNVTSSSWAYDALRWANSKGLVSGDTSDPMATPCTRAYLVSCLWQLAGKPSSNTSIKHFTDVPSNASYANAVKWAVGRSITSGTSTSTFSPLDTITRGQAVTFLYRTYAAN